jgi:hypothetical protein
MTTITTTIRNRRIDVPAPSEIPDGAEVTLTVSNNEIDDNGPAPPEEIARVLAAMQQLEPLEIPNEVAADLDAWERKLNQHGLDHIDSSVEQIFP